MSAVLKLVPQTNTDSVEALEWLLRRARRNPSTVNSLYLMFRDADGREGYAATGIFRQRPEVALRTVLQDSMQMMQTDAPMGRG